MTVSFLCYFQWDVLECVLPCVYVITCTSGARHVHVLLCGAAFVQVWEHLLIPGLFEQPRGARVNVCLYMSLRS